MDRVWPTPSPDIERNHGLSRVGQRRIETENRVTKWPYGSPQTQESAYTGQYCQYFTNTSFDPLEIKATTFTYLSVSEPPSQRTTNAQCDLQTPFHTSLDKNRHSTTVDLLPIRSSVQEQMDEQLDSGSESLVLQIHIQQKKGFSRGGAKGWTVAYRRLSGLKFTGIILAYSAPKCIRDNSGLAGWKGRKRRRRLSGDISWVSC